jgi:hypothetical protein
MYSVPYSMATCVAVVVEDAPAVALIDHAKRVPRPGLHFQESDMTDDVFNDTIGGGDGVRPKPKMVFRAPCRNGVELELLAQKAQAERLLYDDDGRGVERVDIPTAFESETGELENATAFHKHGIPVTDVESAVAFRETALTAISQRFAPLIALARSMGEGGTWEMFRELCKQEGLEP